MHITMDDLRLHGLAPYTVAVLHGGPGAPGYMAPPARRLSERRGVLEPLQTAETLDGQVEELHAVLLEHAALPVVLIGSSWGAMLGYIYAARHPECVRRLVMVGSAVFTAESSALIEPERRRRLAPHDLARLAELRAALTDAATPNKDDLFAEAAAIYTHADALDPVTLDLETIACRYAQNGSVWSGAKALRESGELLAMGRTISCPVLAIHGDYDPHPPEGIREPLERVIRDFRFVMLERCGHYPWIERAAAEEFFALLEREIEAAASEHPVPDPVLYTIVVNGDAQYSIWPAEREAPKGWREVGITGYRDHLLAYAREHLGGGLHPPSMDRGE